jgi:threonine dehydrogenase-like Zn-dependent dehydrogenase
MNSGTRLTYSVNPPFVSLEEYSFPGPTEKQVLVRNTRTHVSIGSEMNFFRDGPTGYGPALDPTLAHLGYMSTGHITAVGAEVKGYRMGDRVAALSKHASHCLVDTDQPATINLIPPDATDDEAGFVALGDVALHSVRRAQLQIDESVAVFGVGMVGQLTLQLARISGAYPIIAVDLLDRRLDLARKSGATHTVIASRGDVKEQIDAVTRNRGVDKSFMCVSAAAALPQILDAAADRGSIMLTGSPSGVSSIRLREDILRKELTITGTYESQMTTPHPYWQWTRDRNRATILRLLADDELQLSHLISQVVPAAKAPDLYANLLKYPDDYLGVVFDWS